MDANAGWIRRHKVASAALALLLVGAIGAATDRDGTPSANGSSGSAAEGAGQTPTKKPLSRPTFLVVDVIDGDTIRLGNGERVRLVGIDSPEDGQCGSAEATENLTSLILGERVRLTISDEDRDRYGRLLRYVDLGNLDAGLRQIKDGFAIARYDSRDGYGHHPREELYIRADRESENFTCP
jgi:endonuclease YncB( thermonuclease family)